MNKKDLPIILLLVALLFAWPSIYKKLFPHAQTPPPTHVDGEAERGVDDPSDGENEPFAARESPSLQVAANEASVVVPADKPEGTLAPEQTVLLENGIVKVTVSSRGATVAAVELSAYRQSPDPQSPPVILAFDENRSLAYEGLANLSDRWDMAIVPEDDSRAVTLERETSGGLRFRRTIALTNNYLIEVTDEFINDGQTAQVLPGHELRLGPMRDLEGETASRGVVTLGVDTLLVGGKGVKYWGKGGLGKKNNIPGWLKSDDPAAAVERVMEQPVDWLAVKSQYFVQILTPSEGGEGFRITAKRRESSAVADEVAASIRWPGVSIEPGETFLRPMRYYVGPKKYAELHQFGLHQVDVMEFGMWRSVGKILLIVMNWIHDTIWPHNYGLAIMLLTIIVRILFWPLTHKGTESMKRMAELQPQMQELRTKYKDNPQKMQQATMALYKENKVNPLGGCLPMVIQIPVFIALFVVLRSAIELRFAGFLWIEDLSQAENLLADKLPFPINILPLVMAATMVWQQKLTPQAGDPRQQKMMATIMPVFMLFILYNFASGLVLYWTTNQCLMIAQMLLQKRRREAKK